MPQPYKHWPSTISINSECVTLFMTGTLFLDIQRGQAVREPWPFVGRADELIALSTFLERRRSAAELGIVLSGAAGVGKTRLLTEFIEAARALGTSVRLVRATRSAAGVPLGCLSALLDLRASDGHAAIVPEMLFHEAVAALVREARQAEHWLLAVDDLPALDEASAAAIHQCLVATGAPMIATARDTEIPPAAFDALIRSGDLAVQSVDGLGDYEVGDLVDHSFSEQLDGWSRYRLVTLAAGNPLMLRQLVAAVEQDRDSFRTNDGRSLGDILGTGRHVQALVDHRLAILEPVERRALEVVAVAEPVAYDVLVGLVGEEVIDRSISTGWMYLESDDQPPSVRSEERRVGKECA